MVSRKGALLKERLETEMVLSSEGKKRYTIKPFEEELSFDKGFYVFIRALQLLTTHNEGTILVGLAGPSGSGKTAFSEKVKSLMPDVCVISMDNYNDGSKVIDSNFDDPRLTDYEFLLQNIKDLKAGKNVQMPIYDYKKSTRVGFKELQVPASRVVIIEGIYALSERLRDLLDLKVSITGGIHFDLVKRVLRDLNRSGLQADEIIQQVSDTVYPMYKAFIEPDLKTAQLKVNNNFNPFSGFIRNPIYILKSKRMLSTEKLLSVLEENRVEVNETELVDIYLLPPNEDPEQCCSWLRMRSRDGRYSLMFEELVTEVPFVISPRISFEVSARILGGLMALGYEIGPVLKRKSIVYSDGTLSIKQDTIEKLGEFVQIHGTDRSKVSEAGRKLGLEGTYIPRSYIEQVQLEHLVAALKAGDVSEHLGLDCRSLVPPNRERPSLTSTESDRRCNQNPVNIHQRMTRAESAPVASSGGAYSDDGGSLTRGYFLRDTYLTTQSFTGIDDEDLFDSPPSSQLSPPKTMPKEFTMKSFNDRFEHQIVELTRAVKTLANVFNRERASSKRESQLALVSIGCVLFSAGMVIGYKYGQK